MLDADMLALGLEFEDWSTLAKDDPDGFEARRKEAVQEFIQSAPSRHKARLERLQWRIDAERRLHPSPMGACVCIYKMMWESVYGEHGLADALESLQHPEEEPQNRPMAQVLSFPGKPKEG